MDELFGGAERIRARAMFIGQRLDLRAFEKMEQMASAPMVVRAGAGGLAVLFRYGMVVFFGLNPSETVSFLEDIESLVIDPFAEPEWDDNELFLEATESEGVVQGRIRLQSWSLQRIQIVADVLAKSVVLAHYEVQLARHFDRIEPLAIAMQKGRAMGSIGKELLQHIGETLVTESRMIGRVEVTEKPELIWEFPEHDRLYLRLEDEYELSERHQALDRKLALISRTAETLLGVLQNQRSLRVEWYIVILIVVEIMITLLEKVL